MRCKSNVPEVSLDREGLTHLPFLPTIAWISDVMAVDQEAIFYNEDEGYV